MRNHDPLLCRMHAEIERHALYRDGERTLVGLSGGADSVCLLHALLSLRGKDALVALHINHGLRGAESDRDEAFCRSLCERLGIRLSVRRVDVRAHCGESGVEETARSLRYAVFAEEAERFSCATVSLAHNANDNLETVLFRLCRGTGLAGLAGIPVKRPLGTRTVVRPLLTLTREEILAYLAAEGLSYVTDSTNGDTRYTRNYIRHEIVPKLLAVNGNAVENVSKMTASLSQIDAFLEASVDAVLPADATSAPRALLCALAEAPRFAALRRMVQNAGGEMLDETHATLLHTFLREGQNGKRIMLPDGLQARMDADTLRVERAFDPAAREVPYRMALSRGTVSLPNGAMLCIGEEIFAEDCAFRATTHIAAASLPTLLIRSREAGDAYRYFGMTHRIKKLRYADGCRTRPVLCDADGVLWLPGFPAADGKWDKGGIPVTYWEKKSL